MNVHVHQWSPVPGVRAVYACPCGEWSRLVTVTGQRVRAAPGSPRPTVYLAPPRRRVDDEGEES